MRRHKGKLAGLIVCVVAMCWTMNSCTGIADGITPVKNFNQEKYLGTWYEIARLDHKFERGLSEITAVYSVKDDGGIKVINTGYNKEKGEWTTAEGKAYFVGESDVAHLKVSFFGPFYGSYVVFDLDEKDYDYAYITSYNKDYLWFLSRTPNVSKADKQKFLDRAKQDGFDVDELIFVDHGQVKQ